MSERETRGVLVVGHGSRREEANLDVLEAARRIGERGVFPLVEAAFLEIARPDIPEGFARLVERGARHIVVHPYFLSPGRHTRGDIPVEVRAAAGQHPGVTFQITEPLNAHRLVIDAAVERIREAEDGTGRVEEERARRGAVYLVGAGPGDPGLLTVKARDLLKSCDAVVYDYLVNPEVLGLVSIYAERVYVGKVGGGRQTPQTEINRLLVELARAGKRVVRLKGGDPFLFGRGGEEAEALHAAGISFEVVPGVSSALAAPAYAGIPLTHRVYSSSVAIVTGARADGSLHAKALAGLASAETVVVLMGMSRLGEITKELIDAGRSPETPAAVVRWGTYEGQQTVTGTLRTIKDEVERACLRAPAVIIVGEVVSLRDHLNWFEGLSSSVVGSEPVAQLLSEREAEAVPAL
ncbi:MAG: uroporphyrinogen-III C-methyltransferase [Pyrinomonadaceae bacterium]